MRTISFFIAWRYLSQIGRNTSISTMTIICMASIFVGSFALTLVTAIMQGFETQVHQKLQGINAPIIIRAGGQQLNFSTIATIIKKEFPDVIATSPTGCSYALIPQKNSPCTPLLITLRAINPTTESTVSTLAQKIISPSMPFDDASALRHTVSNNNILIGKHLARNLGITSGSTLELYYPDPKHEAQRSVKLRTHTVQIGGIFETGIDEFDNQVAFCSFALFNELSDSGITQINLKAQETTDEKKLILSLRKRLGLDVRSWRDLYPAIVSALVLEKYVSFAVIALITLVASMNILSLLFMQITNKRADIAILRVLGATPRNVSFIFVAIGLLITTIGSVIGIALAALASMLLEQYQLIRLPDVYYVSYMPAHMSWTIALIVFAVVISITLIASWIPTRNIATLNIAQILRSEG